MNSLKARLLEEVMDHMSQLQAGDLKKKLDEMKQASVPSELGMEEMPEESDISEEIGKPKGISIKKIEVMDKPKSFDDKADEAIDEVSSDGKESMPGEEDMTDDELEELIKKLV